MTLVYAVRWGGGGSLWGIDAQLCFPSSCEIHSEGMTGVLSRVKGAVVFTDDEGSPQWQRSQHARPILVFPPFP